MKGRYKLMERCPNRDYRNKTEKEKKRDKKNQLSRQFSEFFNIMLNSDYYEGTKYGKYFNGINEDGTSRIYVKDPLEKELEEIKETNGNVMKYLVGYTGIGKTTLLRNFWKVLDRDVQIDNGNLILYISFYYANLSSADPQRSIEDEIIRYIKRSIELLMKKWSNNFFSIENFWNNFFDYIELHKPILLENDEFTPMSDVFNKYLQNKKSKDYRKYKLEKLCEEKRLEYYSCMLKFVLCFIKEIRNIVFIFDDIESKEVLYHLPLVEIARHIHSCFSVIEDKISQVKTIVALRAYTFRSNLDRQSEARRENIKKDTIRKKDVVKFHDIFLKRFSEIERIEKKKDKVNNLSSYYKAKEQFFLIENNIDNNFGNLIYQLVNYNICNAMILYASIMTNVKWVSTNEREYKGRFDISSESYKLTAETVFRAIACGNEIAYVGKNNNFFPNILYVQNQETELLGLYIIKYLIYNNISDLYGEKYIEGGKLLQNIKEVFFEYSSSDILNNAWIEKIISALEYLYDRSILFRSIYDIENISETQIEREFHNSFKIYLSPRGKCLYELFEKNALLLELYRDDIYTDIKNNDKLTYDMSTYEIIKYLLEYILELFHMEQQYIRDATHCLSGFIDAFGTEFLISPLLEGIVKNIRAYYPKRDAEYEELMLDVKRIVQQMNDYSNKLFEKYSIRFTISGFLETKLKNLIV
jgi:hypothetical protein